MVDTRLTMQLGDLNYEHNSRKFSEISLTVLSSSNYILPQDHFTIRKFVCDNFMIKLTSIVIKRRKFVPKQQKYLLHTIVLQKPAQTRSKNTAHFYYIYLYRCEYSDDYKSQTHFHPNILFLYKHK